MSYLFRGVEIYFPISVFIAAFQTLERKIHVKDRRLYSCRINNSVLTETHTKVYSPLLPGNSYKKSMEFKQSSVKINGKNGIQKMLN